MADDQQSLNVDMSALVTALQFGNQQSAAIVNQIQTRFADQAAQDTALAVMFNAAGGTLVSSSPCYLVMISVTAASTGTGLCYDSASVANVGSSNAFMVIPASGVALADWPCLNGLVIQPAPDGVHTVSVSFVT